MIWEKVTDCKMFDVNGSVERTTKDRDDGAKVVVRERRCESCGGIHKTVEYSLQELNRLRDNREGEAEAFREKIRKLENEAIILITIKDLIKELTAD